MSIQKHELAGIKMYCRICAFVTALKIIPLKLELTINIIISVQYSAHGKTQQLIRKNGANVQVVYIHIYI